MDMNNKHLDKNKLSAASSPYLQQHAHNPVHWQEWDPALLEKAKSLNKPLIISIGYAACHWCHVMEHESFMDDEVARVMNQNFISIKVDREERPDIDQVYMDAAQLLTGRGGWPLNAFALPDGRPFYAGTYFTKQQWISVLEQIAELYSDNYPKLEEQASKLTYGIQEIENTFYGKPDNEFSKEKYKTVFPTLSEAIDMENGGLTGAPKFPLPIVWELILQYHGLMKDQASLEALHSYLNNLTQGGIYDQIGGGFARYATDEKWMVPHFEKMLYDNAQLISLFSKAHKISPQLEYEKAIEQSLECIEREMKNDENGFYSSLNADSEGEEGKYYVWTNEEIENVLDEKTISHAKKYFNIKPFGNWENKKNILFRTTTLNNFAHSEALPPEDWKKELNDIERILLNERNKRIRPTTDDKSLTSWNAMMISAYVEAYTALSHNEYLGRAVDCARFLKEKMIRDDGSLWRNYKGGKASVSGFLDDYAFTIDAFISLYQITFDIPWLHSARSLLEYTLEHFYDAVSGFFYYTSDISEKLVSRKKEITDNVIPASNSVMAFNLLKAGTLFGVTSFEEMARKMAQSTAEFIDNPYYANWARLYGCFAKGMTEVVIVGEKAMENNLKLQSNYSPCTIYMGGANEDLPLMKGKSSEGQTLIYVCKDKTCKQPVDNIREATQLLLEPLTV